LAADTASPNIGKSYLSAQGEEISDNDVRGRGSGGDLGCALLVAEFRERRSGWVAMLSLSPRERAAAGFEDTALRWATEPEADDGTKTV